MPMVVEKLQEIAAVVLHAALCRSSIYAKEQFDQIASATIKDDINLPGSP